MSPSCNWISNVMLKDVMSAKLISGEKTLGNRVINNFVFLCIKEYLRIDFLCTLCSNFLICICFRKFLPAPSCWRCIGCRNKNSWDSPSIETMQPWTISVNYLNVPLNWLVSPITILSLLVPRNIGPKQRFSYPFGRFFRKWNYLVYHSSSSEFMYLMKAETETLWSPHHESPHGKVSYSGQFLWKPSMIECSRHLMF